MKKYLVICLAVMMFITTSQPAYALFGGGLKGPLPVYSVDKTVDAATIATQLNTAQQLAAALKNLAEMDSAAAAANAGAIQQTLAQLLTLQQQVQSFVNDYQNFQQNWDEIYNTGGIGADYAAQAAQVLQATDQATYDAMRAQGWAVGTMPTTAENLNALIAASQTAEGALAAAQAGNQIAALQAQQLMILQQTIAANNQAQLAYQKEREQQNADAEAAAAQLYSGTVTPQKGQGPGYGW